MTAPERPPYNPYAAPVTPAAPPMLAPTSARALGMHWKWAYLGTSIVLIVGLVAVRWAATLGALSPEALRTTSLLSGPVGIVRGLVAIGWILAAWNGLPVRWRAGMTPGRALGLLFIPAYGFYWMFAMNLRLCTGLDDGLRAGNDPRQAPKALAVTGAAISLAATGVGFSNALVAAVPWIGIITAAAATAAWFVYMLACDPLRATVAAIAARLPEDPNALREAPRSSIKLAVVLPLGFLLFLLLIAIWQFLSPAPRH